MVPISFSALVIEQPAVREWLVGLEDEERSEKFGAKYVHLLRGFWLDGGNFEQEMKYHKRLDQRNLHNELINSDNINVTLHINQSLDGYEGVDDQVQETFKGNEIISDLVQNLKAGKENMEVRAIEFLDDLADSSSIADNLGDDEMVSLGQGLTEIAESASSYLVGITQTWSTWYAFTHNTLSPTANPVVANNSSASPADDAKKQRIAQLEWEEVQLQSQMMDPFCTREIDEMENELKQIRRELKKLRGGWRRWVP